MTDLTDILDDRDEGARPTHGDGDPLDHPNSPTWKPRPLCRHCQGTGQEP